LCIVCQAGDAFLFNQSDSMASSSKKVIYAAMAGNLLIAVSKFTAAIFTGSSAMLSEGIHSLVDTGNQVLLLFGLRQARKPASENYPYGHGKEVYFWGFVVAIMIFAVGSGVSIYEGVHNIIDPHPVENYLLNYIILGLAVLFEGTAWTLALKEFRKAKGEWGYIEAVIKGKDPSMFIVLFEDSAALLGLMVAFAGLLLSEFTGIHEFDGIASTIIGCILGATAIWLARETKGLLIGESANKDIVEGIRRLTSSLEGIQNINEVLTMHMGPDYILVNISVDFIDNISSQEVEADITRLDETIKLRYPRVKRVFIEAEARRSQNSEINNEVRSH